MSDKPTTRRNPSKYYAGPPENGGDSLTKLVIFYGPGSKPTYSPAGSRHLSGRRYHDAPAGFAAAMKQRFGLDLCMWYDPFYSYDWGKRRAKSTNNIDMETGIEGLKTLLRGQVKQHDVQYAVIAEARYKGAYLMHWVKGIGWQSDSEFNAYKSEKSERTTTTKPKEPTLFRAWVCFNTIGQFHRQQQREQQTNLILFGNSNDTTVVGEVMAIQQLVTQCNNRLLPDWKPYVERIVVYRQSTNKEVGRIEYQYTSYKFFPSDRHLAQVFQQLQEYADFED